MDSKTPLNLMDASLMWTLFIVPDIHTYEKVYTTTPEEWMLLSQAHTFSSLEGKQAESRKIMLSPATSPRVVASAKWAGSISRSRIERFHCISLVQL